MDKILYPGHYGDAYIQKEIEKDQTVSKEEFALTCLKILRGEWNEDGESKENERTDYPGEL